MCLHFDWGHEKAKAVLLNQTGTGELRPRKPDFFPSSLTGKSIYVSQVADDVCVKKEEIKSRRTYPPVCISCTYIFSVSLKKQDPDLTAR